MLISKKRCWKEAMSGFDRLRYRRDMAFMSLPMHADPPFVTSAALTFFSEPRVHLIFTRTARRRPQGVRIAVERVPDCRWSFFLPIPSGAFPCILRFCSELLLVCFDTSPVLPECDLCLLVGFHVVSKDLSRLHRHIKLKLSRKFRKNLRDMRQISHLQIL